jgi:hypothetical protein
MHEQDERGENNDSDKRRRKELKHRPLVNDACFVTPFHKISLGSFPWGEALGGRRAKTASSGCETSVESKRGKGIRTGRR